MRFKGREESGSAAATMRAGGESERGRMTDGIVTADGVAVIIVVINLRLMKVVVANEEERKSNFSKRMITARCASTGARPVGT